MASIHFRLFRRIVLRNREIYILKIVTLAIAFASSVVITLFSINEFGYDRFHRHSASIFRILQRNIDEAYSGNRLSCKIDPGVVNFTMMMDKDSITVSRVRELDKVTIQYNSVDLEDQKIHAADPQITSIFSFDFLKGSVEDFSRDHSIILSRSAAIRYTGSIDVIGKELQLSALDDSIKVTIAAVFEDFPRNSHDEFDAFLNYNASVIHSLNFDPNDTGVYGRVLKGDLNRYQYTIERHTPSSKIAFKLQSLPEIYFGPRVLGEGARHGDSYSILILICIAGLILFLALTTFINLTTLTLPYRSKEIALKKLAGTTYGEMVYTFIRESVTLVGISLVLALTIIFSTSNFIEPILGLSMTSLILHGTMIFILIVVGLFAILSIAPVFMTFRFIEASPNRLLSTDTITFPKFKRVITFLQLGISIFLIVASVVIRRQITYSLLKEPGRNHDQIVYLNCPSGITNNGVASLRSGWKKFNPNILDVMAVSQLPDRINSKEVRSEYYSLLVDAGFRDFFNLQMLEGNWFKVNDGDSIVVMNRKGRELMTTADPSVIGTIDDISGQFNQPEKPVKIKIGPDYNYNWLCVRVLEVDIRRTVDRLSRDFTVGEQKANVRYLNKYFEEWISYQDRLNVLSGALGLISLLLSCCAIYGLSVSLVRDKLKQIAVHKLCGARIVHIVRLLVKEFAKQMLVAIIIFGPFTYIFLNELLRNFIYRTRFDWLDPVYPIAYCAFIITALCGFQALSLNRSDLTSALKG